MDFSNLQVPGGPRLIFSRGNKDMRNNFFILFSNNPKLQERYSDVRKRFQKYIDTNLLQSKFDNDILYSFLVPLKHDQSRKEQIREELKLEIKVPEKVEGIDTQEVHSSKSEDGSESNASTFDSDSGSEYTGPVTKKLKTSEEPRKVSNDGVQSQLSNKIVDPGSATQVDILIYVEPSVCKQLAKYLGLIYVEELLEREAKNFDDLVPRLHDKNGRLYRYIQTCINQKFISGFNNICLVNHLILWQNITATVRAVIVSNPDSLDNRISKMANLQIRLGEHPSFLSYVEAVSLVIDNALSCKCHVIAKYECGRNSFTKIKLSLASIIPFHVLRNFTESKMLDHEPEL